MLLTCSATILCVCIYVCVDLYVLSIDTTYIHNTCMPILTYIYIHIHTVLVCTHIRQDIMRKVSHLVAPPNMWLCLRISMPAVFCRRRPLHVVAHPAGHVSRSTSTLSDPCCDKASLVVRFVPSQGYKCSTWSDTLTAGMHWLWANLETGSSINQARITVVFHCQGWQDGLPTRTFL